MEQDVLSRAVTDLCLLIFLAEFSTSITSRLRIPQVIGTILTGFLFGPNLIGGILIRGYPLIGFNELVYVFSEIGSMAREEPEVTPKI